ncbi:MAG: hypothetical protein H8E91_02030 [Planctomycetes bacterium]|nr:hypothetical protein [Planctomycetota bacterium]
MYKILFIFALAFLFVGCMDVTKVAPKINTLGLHQNIAMLELGRDVYINQCTKCHNAVRITRYSQQQWDNEIMEDMILKSKLSKSQAAAVTAYVRAVLENSVTLH